MTRTSGAQPAPSAGRASLLVLALLGGAGCASANYAPGVAPVGPYRNAQAIVDRADSMSWRDVQDVQALIGSQPEGVELRGAELVVDPGRYELLGQVTASPEGSVFSRFGAWFYDYPEDESWRKPYCYWQVPLVWVTLTFYAWFSPLQYPCRVVDGSSASDIEARKHRLIETLRKGTKALGGNLVVVASFGRTQLVVAGTSQVLDTTEMTRAEGFALRVKLRTPEE
jgi:hypothetical protein